jgi:hypothetical protein
MAQAKLVFIAARAQITGAHPKSSTAPVGSPVRTVYAEFLASLRERPPRPIPIIADSIDLQHRADHLNEVLAGLAGYLAVILDDTGQNTPGGLDLRDAEAILADLASDLSGAIQRAAEEMAGRVE